MAIIQYGGTDNVSPLVTDTEVAYTPEPSIIEGLKDPVTFAYRLNADTGDLATDNTEEFTNIVTAYSLSIRKTPRKLNIASGISSIGGGDEMPTPSTWIIDRLHFLPTVVDVGILTGFKTTYFNLWCTYLKATQLDSVVPVNDDGITLDTTVAVPSDLQSFGFYEMSVTASPEGVNEINASYTFNMEDSKAFDLRVIGNRSAVFAYRHNWDTTLLETYEWLTGVTTASDSSESRTPLRYYPRVRVNQVSNITPEQISDFRARMAAWHSKTFTVPLWQRQIVLQVQALATSFTVTIDNTQLEAKAGDSLIISLGWDDYEIAQIESVTDTEVTLTAPLNSTWRAGAIVSLVVSGVSRLPVQVSGITATQAGLESITFEVSPEDVGTFTPTTSGSIQEYQGSPVMPLRPNWRENIPEQYSKPELKKVDYQSASPFYFDEAPLATHKIDWTYLCGGRTNIKLMREFLFKVQGRHRSFWQPTYVRAFELDEPYNTGSITLIVKDTGYIGDLWDYPEYHHICIETQQGTYYREITAASVNVDEQLVLTIDSGIPEDLVANQIRNISFLQKWRLDTDSVTMIYITDSIANCALSMVTLKEV